MVIIEKENFSVKKTSVSLSKLIPIHTPVILSEYIVHCGILLGVLVQQDTYLNPPRLPKSEVEGSNGSST